MFQGMPGFYDIPSGYYIYTIGPVDHEWHLYKNLSDLYEPKVNDISEESFVLDYIFENSPVCFDDITKGPVVIPNIYHEYGNEIDAFCHIGFMWKVYDNGTTYVASPKPLSLNC